jgi:superfamily II DNA or RNA helicase
VTIKLRDYQQEAVDDILRQWRLGYQGVLLPFATGLGKTMCMAAVHHRLRLERSRILVLAHLGELLTGASETFKLWNPHDSHHWERNIEYVPAGEINQRGPQIVFAMVQSISRRLQKYPRDYFDYIFIDETHRGVAPSYLSVIDHFTAAKRLGVTATPKRADKIGLGAIFDTTSECRMTVTQGIGLGWLVPFRPTSYYVKSLDYSQCKGKGDFKSEDIERALTANGLKPLYEIAAGLKEQADGLQTIVFVSGVDSARELARIMRDEYGESADFICGDTEPEARKDILARYRSGECQRLVNVGVLTEGVDLPSTQCVAIARITRSESLYLQMAGRGTRPYPSGLVDAYDTPEDRVNAILASVKPECLLIDFKGNMGRVRPSIDGRDLLAGLLPHKNYNGQPTPNAADVKKVAEEEGNEKLSIEDLRQLASDELFIQEINSKAEYVVAPKIKEAEIRQFNNLFGLPYLPEIRKPGPKKAEPLPPQQRAYIEDRNKIIWLHERVGLPPPETNYLLSLSKKKAKVVIGKLLQRMNAERN